MESASRNPPWTAEGGLSSEQAQRRRVQDGPNELSPPVRSTGWQRAVAASRDPMLRLLLAATAVYWILGERSDALILLGFVGFSAGITLFQEQRTEKVLHALRELSSPRALVIRDGRAQRVAGTEVVRGDLLVVSEGDRIAADAVLRESSALSVDESALTGESVPVDKDHQGLLGKKARWIYGGTLTVRGQGVAQVVATGPHSEMGRIGDSLAQIARPAPPLVAQTRHLVRLFSILGGLLSVGVVLIDGLVRGDWLAASLAGITLAMALLPEEFALIANAGLILTNRAYTTRGWRRWWGPNAALWRLLAVAGGALAAVVGWPALRPWFQFALPPAQAWAGVGVTVLVVMGLLAWMRRWRPVDQPLDKPLDKSMHATSRNAAQSGS